MTTSHASAEPRSDVPLASVSRSGHVESWHRGAIAIVEGDRLVRSFGDVEQPVFCRSATKPFQALPLIERGIAARLDLPAAELALTTASHDGTEAHAALVAALLARGGFGEGDLRCGPHAPFDRRAAFELARLGRKPTRLHNNCSGKHAGFLLLARDCGDAPEAHLDPDSAAQRLVRQTVAACAGLAPDAVEVGLDGCGAPTFRMPLIALARAFARLANPTDVAPVRAAACRTLLDAITQAPVPFAGETRLCTRLVRALPGRIFPKNGAEGVYAFALIPPDAASPGIGVAIKITDGNERGYVPVVVDLLTRLRVWQAVPDALADLVAPVVWNTQKVEVGRVASLLPW